MENKYLLYNFRRYEINQFLTIASVKKIKILGFSLINLFFKKYQIFCLSKIAHPPCYLLAKLEINQSLKLFFIKMGDFFRNG
jgi:hypothetical protein